MKETHKNNLNKPRPEGSYEGWLVWREEYFKNNLKIYKKQSKVGEEK